MTVSCPCCGLLKKELYCASCLQVGTNQHAEEAKKLQAQVDKARSHAESLLTGPIVATEGRLAGAKDWRELRAAVASAEQRCDLLRAQIASRTSSMEKLRSNASSSARTREQAIDAAIRSQPSLDDVRVQIARVRSQQREVGKHIIQARRVLVREAVDVFGVQRRKAWEIAGIELPPPEQFRLHPSAMINAALVHTVHLLSLLTQYLSIALPFVPTPPPPLELPHVGRPLVVPNLPFINTKKFRDRNVLWMSSSAPAIAKSRKGGGVVAMKQTQLAGVLTKSWRKHRATLTSFALLAHSVAYLAFTQGVSGIGIPNATDGRGDSDDDDYPYPTASEVLVSATSILELLALTAESDELGVRAHEPGTSNTISHLGFGLDVSKVVANVLEAEDARWGVRQGTEGYEELSEGWDLLEKEKE